MSAVRFCPWPHFPSFKIAKDPRQQFSTSAHSNFHIYRGILPFGFLLRIILDHALDRLVERHPQRHVAGDELCKHARGRADLRFAAFVGEQAGENVGADVLLIVGESFVDTALVKRR